MVLAAGVIFEDEGAVDQAADPDRRDVPDAHGLDVLSLPPAAQVHPVSVDADDVVIVRRCLGYRWFQMFPVLFVARTPLRGRTPKSRSLGSSAADTDRGRSPGRCGCLLSYAVPSAVLSSGSGILLVPLPFW